MTNERDERVERDERIEQDEAELRQAFEESADEASREDVLRLARFAASVPGRASAPKRRWLPSFGVQRGLAVAGAALAVAAFFYVRSIDMTERTRETAERTATEPATPGAASESVAMADDPLSGLGDAVLAELNMDSLAGLDDDLFDDPLAGVDMMVAPLDAADGMDAAAWMEVYDRALDDG